MLSTVPGQKNTRFRDVYLKRFKRFGEKIDRKMWFKIFCLQLKRSSLKLFQIYTVQLRKLSTFVTCISVLKPVNPCSCFGRAINGFGKLFSALSSIKSHAGD